MKMLREQFEQLQEQAAKDGTGRPPTAAEEELETQRGLLTTAGLDADTNEDNEKNQNSQKSQKNEALSLGSNKVQPISDPNDELANEEESPNQNEDEPQQPVKTSCKDKITSRKFKTIVCAIIVIAGCVVAIAYLLKPILFEDDAPVVVVQEEA